MRESAVIGRAPQQSTRNAITRLYSHELSNGLFDGRPLTNDTWKASHYETDRAAATDGKRVCVFAVPWLSQPSSRSCDRARWFGKNDRRIVFQVVQVFLCTEHESQQQVCFDANPILSSNVHKLSLTFIMSMRSKDFCQSTRHFSDEVPPHYTSPPVCSLLSVQLNQMHVKTKGLTGTFTHLLVQSWHWGQSKQVPNATPACTTYKPIFPRTAAGKSKAALQVWK